MCLAPKNNWPPSASLHHIKQRAAILADIRHFFAARKVLEVETPLLCHTSVPDVHLDSIPAQVVMQDRSFKTYYLQTSPEYAMKRLLAAYGEAIFQLSKAFRQGEMGRFHQPEFTMLEWYRPQFDHHQLMDEVDDFLQVLLGAARAERKTYAELFITYLNIDPHAASIEQLAKCANDQSIVFESENVDRDTWLDLLMTHCIEPQLGKRSPCFVYDFPASQAALARVREGVPALASRFEVYVQGIELANGFHELQNETQQRRRFETQLNARQMQGLPLLPIDEYLLAALNHGLPDCAGVALGVDRLVMLATGAKHIKKVVSFDFSRA